MKKLVIVTAFTSIICEMIAIAVLYWNGRMPEFNARLLGGWIGNAIAIWAFSFFIGAIVYSARRKYFGPDSGQLTSVIAAMIFTVMMLIGAMH
jgi:hypothetical protein